MCVCVRSESVHATRVLLRIGIVQRTFQAFLAKKKQHLLFLVGSPSFLLSGELRSFYFFVSRFSIVVFNACWPLKSFGRDCCSVASHHVLACAIPPSLLHKKKRKEQNTRAGADTSFARRRDTGVRKSKTKKREKDSSTKQAGKEHTTTQLLSAPPLMIRAALVTHGVTIKTRE